MSETATETAEAAPVAEQAPAFRVESGDPSPEDLAALVLVLAAASGGGEPEPEPERGLWAQRAHGLGVSSRRSSWAWRAGRLR